MATTKKWGVGVLGLTIIGLIGSFVFAPARYPEHTFAQDKTLISAATDLHPVEVFSIQAKASSLQEAFQAAGVAYYPEDVVSFFPDPSLGLGTVVTVARALPVTVVDGKKTKTIRTWKSTIAEALSEKKIPLGQEDRISPSPSTTLSKDTKIVITRVARTEVSEVEVVKFETVDKEDASMWRGEKKVLQEGKNGKREKKYLVIREDGELISKTLTSTNILEAVVNRIVAIGTKLKIGKTHTGKATWYQNNLGTKVAMDVFRRGVEVRITNLSNGRSIIVRNDGCICGAQGVLVDLAPEYFQQLGGTLGQGVLSNVRVEEILN